MEKQKEIANLAYELYVCSGNKEGRDLDNWVEAEKIIAAKLRVEEESRLEQEIEIDSPQTEPKFEERTMVL